MKRKLQMLVCFGACVCTITWATLQRPALPAKHADLAFLQDSGHWADSVLATMTVSDQLAQLLILVESQATLPDTSKPTIFPYSGVIMTGSDSTLPDRARRYQSLAAHPLLLGQLAKSWQINDLALAEERSWTAIEDDSLLWSWGRAIARRSRSQGLNLQLLPAFESGPKLPLVNKMGVLTQAIQQEQVLVALTPVRAYLPFTRDSLARDSALQPYRHMVRQGLAGLELAAAHLHPHPFLGPPKQSALTFLNKQLSFKGLLLTRVDTVPLQLNHALLAGSDLLLVPDAQISQAYEGLQTAWAQGWLTPLDLKHRVKRILQAKYWSHIARADEPSQVVGKDPVLIDRLAAASLTLLRNTEQQIPFTRLDQKRIHVLTLGQALPEFLTQLRRYAPVSHTQLRLRPRRPWPKLDRRLVQEYDPLILALQDSFPDPVRDTLFLQSVAALQKSGKLILVHFGPLDRLSQLPALAPVLQAYQGTDRQQNLAAQLLFGGIGASGRLPQDVGNLYAAGEGDSSPVTRLSYGLPESQGLSSQILAGIDSVVHEGINSFAMPGAQVLVAHRGKVIFHKGYGHHTYARRRKVWLTDLYDLASLTKMAATTAAAMKLYHDRRISLNQRLSHFFKRRSVWADSIARLDTLYAGPALLLQPDPTELLVDQEQDSGAFQFVRVVAERRDAETWLDTLYGAGDSAWVVKSAYAGKIEKPAHLFRLTLAELMSHTSGLPAGLPILPYMHYRDSVQGKYHRFYQPTAIEPYHTEVAAGLYLRQDYWDSIWQAIMLTPMDPDRRTAYSDLNMILVQQALDSLNQQPIDSFLMSQVYAPLGIQHLCFRPRQYFEWQRLVPTEYDGFWRDQLLRGYVHDPAAALLGGVAGNAGLFANANDLAILGQMWLDGGQYGGEEHLRPEVITRFTQAYRGHRGLGFDKPPLEGPYLIADSAPKSSYGHTGFTGTCMWVDPENELVFVFLSNRIHPRANNWKINTLRIRQRVQEIVYQALANPLP